MTITEGNGARFAATPLTERGTPAAVWLAADRPSPLDLSACRRLVIVAAHPDDETLGLGSTAAQLAASGIAVDVVSVSAGGAANPAAAQPDRMRLEAIRRAELRASCDVLGIPAPIELGLPDGRLVEYESYLGDVLAGLLDDQTPGTWCATTWRGDGHPDHEAVGRAAASAALSTGVTLLEYPIWMWHWGSPDDRDVPWHRAASIAAPPWATKRKYEAVQCFRSQFIESEAEEPVLPGFVLDRLYAVGELVFQ